MAEVIAQLEKQVESQKKELEYARFKIQVLDGGVLSREWCCRLLQEAGGRRCSGRIDWFSLCLNWACHWLASAVVLVDC
jgi:hypothetical protein